MALLASFPDGFESFEQAANGKSETRATEKAMTLTITDAGEIRAAVPLAGNAAQNREARPRAL